MKASYRCLIADYFASGRHMLTTAGATPKPISRIAVDLEMSASTVRRWLKANHRDLWLKYWE